MDAAISPWCKAQRLHVGGERVLYLQLKGCGAAQEQQDVR